MLVKKLRLQRGWSQETLAELTGVSARTIQRIEKGYKPGLETAKALASVFEVDISTFIHEENTMQQTLSKNPVETIDDEESDALAYVAGIKEFYNHLILYLIFVVTFVGAALFGATEANAMLIYKGAVGWGIGVVIHGLVAHEKFNFSLFNAKWEKAQVEKRLKRNL